MQWRLEAQGLERYNALVLLLGRFSPDFMEEGKKYIEKLDKATKIIKIEMQNNDLLDFTVINNDICTVD